MPLPLNLAMTPAEIAAAATLPEHLAWMACRFSCTENTVEQLPSQLPDHSLLILDDSIPCSGHSAALVTEILRDLAVRFHCCGVLLDFQRPSNAETAALVAQLVNTLPCPVAVTPEYAQEHACPVLLPPVPLHLPLKRYLQPWKNREIWLEAALLQEQITVQKSGASLQFVSTNRQPEGGFYNGTLCCKYHTSVCQNRITFTLFDTAETLRKKLELAHSLGVTRAVGLWQELGTM